MAYTLFIGTRNISSWSLRAYMAMMATGQPFQTVFVRLRQPETRAQILAFCPAGKVPALKTADGLVVWDSLAICEFLAERHREAGCCRTIPTGGLWRGLMRRRCIRALPMSAIS